MAPKKDAQETLRRELLAQGYNERQAARMARTLEPTPAQTRMAAARAAKKAKKEGTE